MNGDTDNLMGILRKFRIIAKSWLSSSVRMHCFCQCLEAVLDAGSPGAFLLVSGPLALIIHELLKVTCINTSLDCLLYASHPNFFLLCV